MGIAEHLSLDNTCACMCGCGSHSQCARPDTPRRWLRRQKVRVTRDNPSLTISFDDCGGSVGPYELLIRKRGTRKWTRAYPESYMNEVGAAVFMFDEIFFGMPSARYEAQIRDTSVSCGEYCGSLEIDLTAACKVRSAYTIPIFEPLIHSGELPNVPNVFGDLVNFKATLCSVFDCPSTELPLKAEDAAKLCSVVLCCPVQLMIYDSAKSEIVEFSECSGGVPIVKRAVDGNGCKKFLAGATVQFTWTGDNVSRTCEGCP